ncbi:hypothetical protein E2C01_077110 [Portunus trituberculatus]|uniref:Uncharacterized protein n=1 Tax=Portunus trituberculatus TaxID=210409 RepID=A0A5B7IEY7_PORTR|nr:hypothetical protein [Portunus trituberculatus]
MSAAAQGNTPVSSTKSSTPSCQASSAVLTWYPSWYTARHTSGGAHGTRTSTFLTSVPARCVAPKSASLTRRRSLSKSRML